MNINAFTSYFHDGSIHEIKHFGNDIEILMESCEIIPEWNLQTYPLSKFRTIAGSLILFGVKKITINDKEVNKLSMSDDDGEILHFEIDETNIELLVLWQNFLPKLHTSGCDQIVIHAEKFEWKNNPKLPEDFQDW